MFTVTFATACNAGLSCLFYAVLRCIVSYYFVPIFKPSSIQHICFYAMYVKHILNPYLSNFCVIHTTGFRVKVALVRLAAPVAAKAQAAAVDKVAISSMTVMTISTARTHAHKYHVTLDVDATARST